VHVSRCATTHHTRGDVREPTVRPDRSRLCAAVILKGLRAPDEFGNGESTAPDCSAHDADWRMSRGQCLAIQACGTIRSSDLVSRGQLPFWRQSRALLIAGQLTHDLRPTPMKARPFVAVPPKSNAASELSAGARPTLWVFDRSGSDRAERPLRVSRVAFNSARRCNRRRSRPARYWRVFGERDGHDRETDSYRVPSTLDIAPRDALPANARERLRGCLRGDPPSDWVAM